MSSAVSAPMPLVRPPGVLGLDRHQILDRGGQHSGQRAEPGQQGLGDRLDVALGLAAEQEQLQQLIVGQVVDAGPARPLPQPLAMTGVVGRFGFFRWLFQHGLPRPRAKASLRRSGGTGLRGWR